MLVHILTITDKKLASTLSFPHKFQSLVQLFYFSQSYHQLDLYQRYLGWLYCQLMSWILMDFLFQHHFPLLHYFLIQSLNKDDKVHKQRIVDVQRDKSVLKIHQEILQHKKFIGIFQHDQQTDGPSKLYILDR